MFDLPAELVIKPLALIGVTGLDIGNPIHKPIWDALSNNRRVDNGILQFKLLNPGHIFPTLKPKRVYEYYVPKGILKRNWMNKYLNEVPSLVVIFNDLDWKDPLWNEKKIECASRVQSLRAALEGRNTKIAVVLIQQNAQPPPGTEDIIATERATALCGACELPPKLLYILPHGDHLVGYITRLETVFCELAQSFYYQAYKVVKSHKDHLNKTSNQYLSVRHQFKMGFLNEFRQELHISQKHYLQAYSNLTDIRAADTNVMEIKTIAGFINYKLCKLMFKMSLPKDAIAQLKGHTERYKLMIGPKELVFEHHAWMSSQYSIFAELFDDAIRQGLPAVQTQHPGYYYQMAAHHTGLRQGACRDICKNVTIYPEPDPLSGGDKLEFYGQRPWRPGKLSADPGDLTGEIVAIQALQYKEKYTVNHSMIIIGLLGNAISQFKMNRCPRMRRLLVVQMAEEYYNSKDYGKVLTLLMHMLWECHSERWPVLLTDIIKNALRAAYLATSIQDYLALAVEALGPLTTFSVEQQAVIYSNIANILEKKPPIPEPDLPDDTKFPAMEKWASELSRPEPLLFSIDDNNTTLFIEAKARFSQSTYTINSTVNIDVFVRNSYCGDIELSKISVTISSPGCNSELSVIEIQDYNFTLHAKEMRKFTCHFQPAQQIDGSEIRINAISVFFGIESSCSIVLRFSPVGREVNFLDRLYPEIQQLRGGEFETIRPAISAVIKQEDSSVDLTVDSKCPALLGEWFPLNVKIFVTSNIDIAVLNASLVPDGSNEQSTELSITMQNKQSSLSVSLNNLQQNTCTEQIVYLRAHKIGDRKIVFKVEYVKSDQTKRIRELSYKLTVVKAFEVTTQFYTTLFESLSKAFLNEPFIMMPHISCVSPWPIEIMNTSVDLGDSVQMENKENQESILSGFVLSDNEAGTDAYCLIPKKCSDQPVSTGVYSIRWKRANDETAIETSSSVTLAPLWVENAIIGLEMKLPAHGWVRTPFCVAYFIKNHSDYLITLRLTMETSAAFMFAGQKQIDIYILPQNEKKIEWILRPLVAGFVALPKLSLTVPADQEHKINKARLVEVLERSLPSHIYVLPKSNVAEE
ncbi:trafficking protein particle complex subunit 11-like [Prorops nasuta]|uniref:trafficking protein particle complex subunit 11-like n=1 Tax=Prorops nasuta TaxID=863751 RepID=UPI0034CE2088